MKLSFKQVRVHPETDTTLAIQSKEMRAQKELVLGWLVAKQEKGRYQKTWNCKNTTSPISHYIRF